MTIEQGWCRAQAVRVHSRQIAQWALSVNGCRPTTWFLGDLADLALRIQLQGVL
jgi:hypothetical protein